MKAHDCPRFDECSANRCPLDDRWRERPHLAGERVCFYLTEAVKDDAAARFSVRSDEDIHRSAVEMLSEPESLGAHIRHALERAASSGSQLERGFRLAQSRGLGKYKRRNADTDDQQNDHKDDQQHEQQKANKEHQRNGDKEDQHNGRHNDAWQAVSTQHDRDHDDVNTDASDVAGCEQ